MKVYELRDNDWFDRGTGFCTGEVINVRPSDVVATAAARPPVCSATLEGLAMSEEKNTDQRIWMMQDVPKIFVESEDEKGRYLLETEIGKDEGYQKQQGLIITSPDRDTRQETDPLRPAQKP